MMADPTRGASMWTEEQTLTNLLIPKKQNGMPGHYSGSQILSIGPM
jgi:hypothetical protein